MLVIDASAAIDLLLGIQPYADEVANHLRDHDGDLHAPHLLDAEVGQAFRRFVLRRELRTDRAHRAIIRLARLPLNRYPHTPLLPYAFDLLKNLTVYDALYVTLARALDAPLLTRDQALARAARRHARIIPLRG